MRRGIVVCFLLGLISSGFSCLAQQYNFKNYSVSEGLSQSQVYAISEDTRGYLWLGTRGGGVSVFNGTSFTYLTEEDGLISNYINDIHVDPSGVIWIGSDAGLSRYNGDTLINYHKGNGLNAAAVYQVTNLRSGKLCLSTSNGVWFFDKGLFAPWPLNEFLPQKLVFSHVEDSIGQLTVASHDGLAIQSGMRLSLAKRVNRVHNENFQKVIFDNQGQLVIGSYGGGLSIKTKSGFQNFSKSNGLDGYVILDVFEDKDGYLWIGTEGMGVFRFDGQNFRQFSMADGMPHNTVRSIFQDSWGNMWFGTSGGGVSRFDGEMFVHYTEKDGLPGNGVYAIGKNKRGQRFFGTFDGGVIVSDSNGTYPINKQLFTSNKVKVIYEGLDSSIYFGSEGDGLFSLKNMDMSRIALPSVWIKSIIQKSDSALFLGTAGTGLIVFTGDETRILNKKSGLPHNRVNDLCLDKQENVWCATDEGIAWVDTAEIAHTWEGVSPLPQKKIKSVCIDKFDHVWYGTSGAGIGWIRNDSIRKFTRADGLNSNNVYLLHIDLDGYLWVGTEKGLDRLTINSNGEISNIRFYGKAQGFTGIETCQNAVYQDEEGPIWFGTIKGATRYNPQKDRPRKMPPRVHLTSVKLFYEDVANTEFARELDQWTLVPKDLFLPYNQNHLTFSFEGISLKNGDLVKYKWRLAGFDDRWSPESSLNTVTYSNLAPGKYVFEVQAIDENGVHSEMNTFFFEVDYPFWRDWWFQVLALVLFFGAITLFVFAVVRRIRARDEVQRRQLELERKTIELEQQALRLQMNPHFLFNCLNSIKGYISEQRTKEAKLHLSKFAKLMRQILDNSRETYISLDVEILTLTNYLELEQISHEDKFQFNIEVEESLKKENVMVPTMIVQPFVENAIIHGVMSRNGGGEINISFKPEGDKILCEVKDNGIGRAASRELQKGSVQRHHSRGIEVTEERLKVMSAEGSPSGVVISDILSETGEVEGTSVHIMLPMK